MAGYMAGDRMARMSVWTSAAARRSERADEFRVAGMDHRPSWANAAGEREGRAEAREPREFDVSGAANHIGARHLQLLG